MRLIIDLMDLKKKIQKQLSKINVYLYSTKDDPELYKIKKFIHLLTTKINLLTISNTPITQNKRQNI